MVHVSVQVVSSYVTPWLSNTGLISVISFVITLYMLSCEKASLTIVRSLGLLHCLISHHHLLYIFLSTADLLGFQPVKF
jgi:hypothetical protein